MSDIAFSNLADGEDCHKFLLSVFGRRRYQRRLELRQAAFDIDRVRMHLVDDACMVVERSPRSRIASLSASITSTVHSRWCTNKRAWRVGGEAEALTCGCGWAIVHALGHGLGQRLGKSTNSRSVLRIGAFAGRHGGVTDSSATGKELVERLDAISW
jgi:hypothetical protein